jgi:hypothetical protein
VGGLEPADDCLGLELAAGATATDVTVGVGVVALADLAGWAVAAEDGKEEACRKMTMRPSEWAEKIASTTTSSSAIAATR